VVLTDLQMPNGDGVDLIRRARRRDPDTPILVFTAQASVETAVEAMREGAFDYLRKTAGGQELRAAVDRAAQHGSLTREVRRLRDEVRDAPFVAFDCSALAPSLLESELFGHEKGAFTGAARARRGLFREAHGGTLFLDEIGDIAPEVQNKLLRVLQEREIKPVGGDTFVKVDVRILAATNKDLRALVARGAFREDLYWRLAVVPLEVPPLRDRREDLPLLCAHILARKRPAAGVRWPTSISTAALAKLAAYPWPGNIRELENVLARAALLSDGQEIKPDDLPLLSVAASPSPGVEGSVADGRSLKVIVADAVKAVEKQAIKDALARSNGSPGKAARLLGISRASIYNKLKDYGLE
jgi:DNA-binding NtrC family response regulator